MSGVVPYLLFPGNAAEALEYYRAVFGGDLEIVDFAHAGRPDGPADAVADGRLNGQVCILAADAAGDDDAVHMTGMFLSLVGIADASTQSGWFDVLAAEGRVLQELKQRPSGAFEGALADRYGVRWLIGFAKDTDKPTAH